MNLKPKYIKSDDQWDAFLCLILFAPMCFLVILYEKDIIAQDLLGLYLTLKLGTTIVTGFFLYLASRNPYNQFYIFMASMGAVAYAGASEYFSPLYHYAYIMSMLGFAILLRPKLMTLLPAIFLGSIPVLYFQHAKEIGLITHGREPAIVDYIFISLEFTVIIFAIFEGFSKRRRREIHYRERFSLLGEDLNTFAHNIKSMLSSQFIINQNLQQGVESNECVKDLLKVQEENLEDVHEYLNNFNLLAKSDLEEVNVSECVNRALKLVNIPCESVQSFLDDNISISLVRQDFESILINTFSNGKKALRGSNGEMKVTLRENKLEISFPFSATYKTSSGIGESISRKLALKNNLSFDTDIDGDKYQTIITM